MPLPTPGKDEKQDDWIARCMGTQIMKDDFPDNKQRLAVCFQKWRDKDKQKDSSSDVPERRQMPGCELRVDGQKEPKLVGYAATFNTLSEVMWGFREKIAKGAFADSIQRDDIRMLWNHDPNYVLARNTSGTLKLWEDDKGLGFEATPPDTQWARDLVTSIKRRDISDNSFGFGVANREEDESWESKDGMQLRTLLKVKLYDVSAVTYPAYPQTQIFVRAKNNFYVLPEDKFLFSFGPPTEIRSGEHGEEKANPTVITPPPLVDPEKWAAIQEKLKRRK